MHPAHGSHRRHLQEVVDVTVIVPTIPGREKMLVAALNSVHHQTVQPAMTMVETDVKRRGAAATRNTAMSSVQTEWMAFLDDDDELYPDHMRLCLAMALKEDADLVYPSYDVATDGVVNADADPAAVAHRGVLRSPRGLRFGDEQRDYLLEVANFIPITALVRTDTVRAVGGFDESVYDCEDWALWKSMLRDGAKFVHLPQRTWRWNWHGAQTQGRGAQTF